MIRLVDFFTTFFKAAIADLLSAAIFYRDGLKEVIKGPFEHSGSVIWLVVTCVEASAHTHIATNVRLHIVDLCIKLDFCT